MSFGLLLKAAMVGVEREMYAPDVNPYTRANIVTLAMLRTPRSAHIMVPESRPQGMMTWLNLRWLERELGVSTDYLPARIDRPGNWA
jgi:hypothetical protein